MPRGNLEQVHPRQLVVPRLQTLLDALDFRLACTEMRRHRVDMNLVFDHRLADFVRTVDGLLAQLDPKSSRDMELLQLATLALTGEDSRRSPLFASFYSPPPTEPAPADKVARICACLADKIGARLNEIPVPGSELLYFNLLTAIVKAGGPEAPTTALLNLKERLEKCGLLFR